MPRNAIYLEAPDRTQDLLNVKWSLRSAGYAIGSTWHEGDLSTSLSQFKNHWSAKGVDQLQACDSLVVICGGSDAAVAELAAMAGFALARGIRVIWIGPPVRCLADFRAVQQFKSAEDFRTQLLSAIYSKSASSDERLAA